jgi:hypothetical protein
MKTTYDGSPVLTYDIQNLPGFRYDNDDDNDNDGDNNGTLDDVDDDVDDGDVY